MRRSVMSRLRAGRQLGVDEELALDQLGHELAAEPRDEEHQARRQQGEGDEHGDPTDAQHAASSPVVQRGRAESKASVEQRSGMASRPQDQLDARTAHFSRAIPTPDGPMPGLDPTCGIPAAARSGARPLRGLAAKVARGQHRNQRQRHDQRDDQREGDGQRLIAEELAGDALDEDDRHEDADRGQRAGDHRPRHLAGSLDGRLDLVEPWSRRRWIASSTTIELSTSRPMPRVSPPSDMMLSEIPETYIRKNVAITEIGIAMPMINVVFQLRRKKNRTRIASTPPYSAVRSTSETDWRM